MHLTKQVPKKNVLGAAFTNQASDTLCISISYIDMFHIKACAVFKPFFLDTCFDSEYL